MATHSGILAWRISGMESLVGCRLWGCTESDMTKPPPCWLLAKDAFLFTEALQKPSGSCHPLLSLLKSSFYPLFYLLTSINILDLSSAGDLAEGFSTLEILTFGPDHSLTCVPQRQACAQ